MEALLALLLTSGPSPITDLYRAYAADAPRMSREQWLTLCAAEQPGTSAEEAQRLFDGAIADARGDATIDAPPPPAYGAGAAQGPDDVEMASSFAAPAQSGEGLTPLMFQALLLSASNRAACPARAAAAAGPLDRPMCDYWVASSHNTYLIDPDQLAGRSSSDMYARVLLQGCRSVEVRPRMHARALTHVRPPSHAHARARIPAHMRARAAARARAQLTYSSHPGVRTA